MSHKKIKEWITKAGFNAAVLWVNDSHYCGYVAVKKDNPFYRHNFDNTYPQFIEEIKKQPMGKRGVVPIFFHSMNNFENIDISILFDVHGSITFANSGSDGYPSEELKNDDLWWFGFDCGHDGDSPDVQNLEYVISECESLAKQILYYQNKIVIPSRDQ